MGRDIKPRGHRDRFLDGGAAKGGETAGAASG